VIVENREAAPDGPRAGWCPHPCAPRPRLRHDRSQRRLRRHDRRCIRLATPRPDRRRRRRAHSGGSRERARRAPREGTARRPPHRRDRRRQRGHRRLHSSSLTESRRTARGGELRRAHRERRRERALRPREGAFTRRCFDEGRLLRSGRRRRVLPRRDRRASASSPGEAPPGPRDEEGNPRRGDDSDLRRRPHRLGNAPGSRRGREGGHVPPGPLLPPERYDRHRTSAPRAQGRRARARAHVRGAHRILAALASCDDNQTRAAERLSMPRRTLVARLQEYGLTKPRRKPAG